MTSTLPGGGRLGDRYRLDRVLGVGGSATVYRAHDGELDRTVAVKVFNTVSADPDARLREQAELRTLARLVHPALVTLYDGRTAGPGDGPHYLVLEFVDGPTLAELLRGGPLSVDRVAEIGATIADGLGYVHRQGVVHRDVKPGNILIGSRGQAKLTDFGIVQGPDHAPVTGKGVTVGTAAYLSPEQVLGDPVGPATDIYALGLVLIEALTGDRAYPGPAVESALARLSRRPHLPAGVTPALGELLTDMTAPDPDGRPHAQTVAARLRKDADSGAPAAAAPTPVVSEPDPDVGPVPRQRSRRRAAGALGSLLALLALLSAVTEDNVGAGPATAAASPATTRAPVPGPVSRPQTAATVAMSPATALVMAALPNAVTAGPLPVSTTGPATTTPVPAVRPAFPTVPAASPVHRRAAVKQAKRPRRPNVRPHPGPGPHSQPARSHKH